MLKPSDMGVTGTKRTIKAHEDKVRKKNQTFRKKVLGSICDAILDSPSGTKLPTTGLTAPEINEIKNYYAEVAAPILIANFGLMAGVRKATSQCYYSTSDTERLYDFKIFVNGKEELISNKQMSGGTNTLKPGDVIALVDKDPVLTKKWAGTKYYKVFKILDESNVVSGPIRAVSECYPRSSILTKDDYKFVLSRLTQNEVLISPKDIPKNLMTMIKADASVLANYKKNGGISGAAINFMFEKIMVDISKNDDKYNELFVDVTSGNVLFFKFDLNAKGILSYALIDPRNATAKTKKAALRSKQGVERRSSSSGRLKLDKLGFQP